MLDQSPVYLSPDHLMDFISKKVFPDNNKQMIGTLIGQTVSIKRYKTFSISSGVIKKLGRLLRSHLI